MTITKKLSRGLHTKQWQWMLGQAIIGNSAAGIHIANGRLASQRQYVLASASAAWMYDPYQDAATPLPSPGLSGTFGAAACSVCHPMGPSGTATGGTTATIVTNLTLARDLRGMTVRITGGPGAGHESVIASNTIGANATITMVSAAGTSITASSTYQLITGRWFVLNCGTLAAGSFRVYDWALNSWSSLSITNLPATIATTNETRIVATPSIPGLGAVVKFNTNIDVASSTSTVITQSGPAYTTNQWVNAQVRITAGTGAGQIRTISANTGTTITVPSAFTTTPDATSKISIEGNDDFLYVFGNAAVTAYRYSISGNTWTVLSPGAARAGAPASGMSANWIYGVNDSAWTNANAVINGRRIYSFRGSATALDYYDIAANTWVSGISYAPANVSPGAGSSYTYIGDYLYTVPTAGQNVYRFNFIRSELEPWSYIPYAQNTAVIGDRMFDFTVSDGIDVSWIYYWLNTSNVMGRSLIID
jgi:hypothetical protein